MYSSVLEDMRCGFEMVRPGLWLLPRRDARELKYPYIAANPGRRLRLLEPREKGSPQGSGISPLFANLFLHWAFDRWMVRHHPATPFERLFERFAEDILGHCDTERQARILKGELERRFAECGLQLHPDKTRIVYCKDDDRRGTYPHEKFDFLGYTFRARRSKNRWGKYFVNFSPGGSNRATKAIREEIRRRQLRCRADKWIDDPARMFNPIIRGWLNYYGRYYKSALYPTLRHLDRRLAHWAMAKYKRLKRHRRQAEDWIREVPRVIQRSLLTGRYCIGRRLGR